MECLYFRRAPPTCQTARFAGNIRVGLCRRPHAPCTPPCIGLPLPRARQDCLALQFRNHARFGIAGQTDRELSFDIRYGTPLQARSKCGCRSSSSGPTRASDAVNEVFGDLRQIVVHNVRDSIYVDPSGGEVGGYQNAIRAGLKAAKSLAALTLAAVPMNGSGLDATVGQPSSQPLRSVLCPGEHEK